jgi:hypothetical protein
MCDRRGRSIVRSRTRALEDVMLLATLYLDRYAPRLRAYNMLQLQLMACFIRRGGTPDAWCTQYASAFRRRFGWMLAER